MNLYLNGKKNCKTEFNIVDIQCDVVDETQCKAAVEAVSELYGGVRAVAAVAESVDGAGACTAR